MVTRTPKEPAVRPELVELTQRVEKIELQARLFEAQVKMIKAREELQRLQGRAKS